MDRATRSVWRWAGVFVTLGLLGLAMTARAGVPPRGAQAPYFSLDSLAGEKTELSQFAGKPVVLIFGDLRHENARKASREVLRALEDRRLKDRGVVPLFLTAEHSTPEEMARLVEENRFPKLVLHDPDRAAFGAYEILVIPSVVIVDGQGIVVHAMPGFLPRFEELLTQSLLVATGQMTDEAFEASLGGGNGHEQADPNALKAERLVNLGKQLLGHGMEEMAEARFKEAVSVHPDYGPGRRALGDLYRGRGMLDEAESQFRALLSTDPGSLDGALGLARVQIDQGGPALDDAEKTVLAALDRHPGSALAHYELGLIREARGDQSEAAASYRKAAELLLAQ